MKQLEQLDKLYSKALKDFEVTPVDEQWQRLSLALQNEQKNKRRRYLFLVFSIIFTSIVIASLFVIKTDNKSNADNKVVADSNKEISLSDRTKNDLSKEFKIADPSSSEKQVAGENEFYKNASNPNDASGKKNNTYGQFESIRVNINNKFESSKEKEQVQPKLNSQDVFGIQPFGIQPFGIRIVEAGLEMLDMPKLLTFNQSAVISNNENKNKSDNSGLFMMFSAGLGNVNNNLIQIENASKQHKDVGQIFKALNGNYQAKQIQAGITYVPKKGPGISFAGGIQYRELSHVFNFKYNYKEIPFKDTNGNILGYVKDTGSGLPINLIGVNKLRFFSLPVYLRTPIWANNNSELFVGAGMQFQVIAGAAGEYFNINQLQLSKTKPASFKAWNMGYSMGLGYSRKIGHNLSMYGEIQGMTNMQIQKLATGDIRSRMTAISTQIGIKYKIK